MKQTNFLSQKPSGWIAVTLIFAILVPTAGPAQSRHSAPEAIRSRVLNLGVGQWVRVREHTGLELDGKITGIGPQVFQMQRRDAVGPTWVHYTDVVRLRRARASRQQFAGPSDKPWIATAIALGIIALFTVCGDSGCHQSNTAQSTH